MKNAAAAPIAKQSRMPQICRQSIYATSMRSISVTSSAGARIGTGADAGAGVVAGAGVRAGAGDGVGVGVAGGVGAAAGGTAPAPVAAARNSVL